MNKFVLATESTADLPASVAEEYDIKIMYLHYVVGGEEHCGDSLTMHEFYERLRAGERSITSQGNPSDYDAFWRPYLEEGCDILHLALSSAISGTYKTACKVAEDLKKEFPERTIYVVDSLSAAPGLGFFMTYIAKYRDQGHDVKECYEYTERMKLKFNYIFTVDDLRTLVSTGRVTATEAFLGRVLQIKPILFINNSGELKPFWKVVSRKVSLKFLCDRAKTKFVPETDRIVIGHADCPQDAEKMKEYLKTIVDPKIDIDIWEVGPVIGSHVGPDMMSIFFIVEDRLVKPY